MNRFFLFACLGALIILQALDMELTRHYIGDNWEHECFPPMKYTIKYLGFYPAAWVARTIFYSFVLFFITFYKNPLLQRLLIVATILYYASMVQWLFTLKIISFP